MQHLSFISYKTLFLLFIILACTSYAANSPRHFPPGAKSVYISEAKNIQSDELKKIAPLIKDAIDKGYYPGAVILASHNGEIIYRGVFGNRRILPNKARMSFDTIFDVASLTKPVVTATAVMQLVEQGKLNLYAPVALYWPAFAGGGKGSLTVRDLLTHTSGLQADIDSLELSELLDSNLSAKDKAWEGKAAALKQIEQLKPIQLPRTKFIYSDINFISLGYLVEIVSGERLDHYAQK